MNNGIGGSEINPYTAGFETDQKNRDFGCVVKALDPFHPVGSGTVQINIVDSCLFQIGPDDFNLDPASKIQFFCFAAEKLAGSG